MPKKSSTQSKSHRVPIPARVSGSNNSSSNPHGADRRGVLGMSGLTFQLADLAYTKLIIHALKYPHQTVNGVLLGSSSPSGTVEIVDAVPLQHHWTSLSPMMEVGLGMVRSSFILLSSLLHRLSLLCASCGYRPLNMPTVASFM